MNPFIRLNYQASGIEFMLNLNHVVTVRRANDDESAQGTGCVIHVISRAGAGYEPLYVTQTYPDLLAAINVANSRRS